LNAFTCNAQTTTGHKLIADDHMCQLWLHEPSEHNETTVVSKIFVCRDQTPREETTAKSIYYPEAYF